jgi:hypothetical protein
MEARSIPALVAAILCAVSGSWAGDNGDRGGSISSVTVASIAVSSTAWPGETVEPWIHPAMVSRVKKKLEAGFDLAVERVRNVDSCSDLFTQLGADGIDMLKTGLYLPVDSYRREVEVCGRNPVANSRVSENLAYTTVGGAPTWICRQFSKVSDEHAAVTVIHEALHHAGLSERPLDRTAMSSVEISEMVKTACGL